MAGRGHTHHALNDINRIRDLLDERYEATSVLRELIQNADDAGATELRLAVHSGWPESSHALLRGPGVVVINNGDLTKTHVEGIRGLGIGTKVGESRAIGKFGLGMKSVYHLCEAFFYLASANQPAVSAGCPTVDLLNPWSGSRIHDDWDDFEASSPELHGAVAALAEGMPRWFALWLPLRQPEHYNDKFPLMKVCWTAERALSLAQPQELAALLPLLRSLTSVSATPASGAEVRVCCRRDAKLEVGAGYGLIGRAVGRLLRRHPEEMVDGTEIRGRLEVGSPGGTGWDTHFYGRQCTLDDEVLRHIHSESDEWPVRATIDPATGEPSEQRHEVSQHAAVVFLAVPRAAGSAHLCVSDAAFLPIGDGARVGLGAGPNDYRVLLHGDFIPDTGRRVIKFDEPTGWNHRLRQAGVLPLVLPSLAGFVVENKLDEPEIARLTDGLAHSQLYREHREAISHSGLWCRRLTEEGLRWCLVEGPPSFLPLPTPPAQDPALPFRVFPRLVRRGSREVLLDCGSPHLGGVTAQPLGEADQWLVDLPEETLTDAERCDYLLRTLDGAGEQLTIGSRQFLAGWLREALVKAGLTAARSQGDHVRQLVGYLPEATWVVVPRVAPFDRVRLVEALIGASGSRLILPEDLRPDGRDGGRLMPSETAELMQWLVAGDVAAGADVAAVAAALLARTSGTHEQRLAACGDIKAFQVYDGQRKREISASWNQLALMREQGRLFTREGQHYFEPLQAALVQVPLFALPRARELAPLLFDGEALSGCGVRDCLEMLCRRPALQSADSRCGLLDVVAKCPSGYDAQRHRQAVRYLLHGDAEHFDDAQTALWGPPDGQVDKTLERFAVVCLGAAGQGWRFLPASLESKLNGDDRRAVGVQLVDHATVAALLDSDTVGAVAAGVWSAEERATLLPLVSGSPAWRELPWHETIDGRLVTLTGAHVYLASERAEAPPALAPHVDVLREPSEREVRRGYRQAGVQPWSAEATLRVALDLDPRELWREIMGAVAELGDTLPPELAERLRAASWIPDGERAWSPAEVVAVDGLGYEAGRLLKAAGSPGVASASLPPEVTRHPAWEAVRAVLLPSRSEALAWLRTVAETAPGYALGAVELPLPTLLRALDGFDGARLPALGLLRDLDKVEGERDTAAHFLKILKGSLDSHLVRDILRHIQRCHQDSPDQRLWEAHLAYTGVLRAVDAYSPELLRDLMFPSRQGGWRSSNSLCFDAEGVEARHLLDARWAASLRGRGRSAYGQPPGPDDQLHAAEPSNGSAAEVLLAYFAPWEACLHDQRPLIGAFLSLLGGDPEVVALAERYLLPRFSVESFHQRLPYRPMAAGMVGADEPVHQALHSYRFSLTVLPAEQRQCNVPNLLGETIPVPLSQTPTGLLVGEPYQNGRRVQVVFRQLDPTAHRQQLAELLAHSAQVIWRRVYWQQHNEHLSDVLAELARTDQVDLQVVQETLLDHCLFYLQQLKAGQVRGLDDLRDEWDQASYGIRGNKDDPAWRQSFRARLRQRLETNPSLHDEVLEAMRQRLAADYQYSPDSVPFELFQNSDDAAVELVDMAADTPSLDVVRVVWNDRALRWVHWGRRINQEAFGALSREEGQRRGYYKDLQKMLVVNASDKGRSDEGVTGRFGLGFKSVYLCSDTPRIVSGRLAVEVVGGVWPQRLAEPDEDRLRLMLTGGGDDQRPGTVVELPLRADCEIKAVMQRFLQLLPLQLAFARQIKRCCLAGPDGEHTVIWNPRVLDGCRGVTTGMVDLPGLPGARVLVFTTSQGQIVLLVGPRGFRPMPAAVPTFWVTAPTREEQVAGVAFNARFAIDVGRAQLARDAASNSRLADVLGAELGDLLVGFYDVAASEWDRVRAELGLDAKMAPYDFWASLLATCALETAATGSAVELARRILWRRGHGLALLVEQRPALPTHLPGGHRCLTSTGAVKVILGGFVSQTKGWLETVVGWPTFRKMHKAGTVVAQEVVAADLPADLINAATCRLADLLAAELGHEVRLPPDFAGDLGRLLEPASRRTMTQEEQRALADLLSRVHLLAVDHTWQQALRLVSSGAAEAVLAPPSQRLDPTYEATTLVALGIQTRALDARVIADWAGQASSTEQRSAVLDYLVSGAWSKSVAEQLRQRGGLKWFGGQDDPAAQHLTPGELGLLLDRLGLAPEVDDFGLVSGMVALDPAQALQAVAAWWQREAAELLPDHLASLYHDGGGFLGCLRRPYTPAAKEREAWLTLLLRGGLESMGRVAPEAHREFVRTVSADGWLRQLAEQPRSAAATVDRLREKLDERADKLPYLHWLRYYLPLAVMARWTDDYVQTLLDFDSFSAFPGNLETLLSPRVNAEYSGGGPDAPPLYPVLGIGACFVVRELARVGLVCRQEARRFAFVPRGAVRRMVARLGGPELDENAPAWLNATRIYDFVDEHLDEPTFGGCYDIPLRILADDSELFDRALMNGASRR